jgi:hypothetical protein
MIIAGIKEGGTEFQYFDGYLDTFYKSTFGVQEVERYPWDPSQAPTGWDTATQGTPDYVISRLPEYVIDSYRDKNGKLTEASIRKNLGGSALDIEPRTGHRYSLAKIEYSDSGVIDEAGLFKDGRPVFLDSLFEWKDQADLNIKREIDRLEQKFLAEFGGSKPKGRQIGISAGKLSNNSKTRLLQKAMNLYIDSGEKTPHLKFVRKYMHELEGKKKLTNIEKDRLAIIKRMLEMTEEEKAFADNEIRDWYNDMYMFAQERGILDTYVEGYVRRAWKVPKDHKIAGAAVPQQTAGTFSNFKITTPRAKQRSFASIIDAWRDDQGWTLKNDAVMTNLSNYMNEINEVATNKRFINYMQGLKDADGDGVITDDISEKQAAAKGLVELHARGFTKPFQKIYARPDVANVLNNVTESGVSDLWSVVGIKALTTMNAMIKGMVLSISAFHHFAGVRSWEFGVHGGKLNPVTAFKQGLKKVETKEEMVVKTNHGTYSLGPIADYLIRNGLTIGKVQDWDQAMLAGDKSLIEGFLAHRTSDVARRALEFKRSVRHGRERWTRSLFNRFFAGLKVEAGAVELAHAIRVAEKKQKRGLTEAELKAEAVKVGRLINADFGGLHLKRMGRNMNMQKIAQLLLLAPDWTESNFRTVLGMIPGLNTGINHVIGDFKPPAGMSSVYRKFWTGISLKMLGTYLIAYLATYAVADEDDQEIIANNLTKDFSSVDDVLKARWAKVPLEPWINLFRKEDERVRENQHGINLGGHFFDILKLWEPGKLAMHKGSPVVRNITSLVSGKDWKGEPFTEVQDIPEKGLTGNSFDREGNFFRRLPSWLITQVTGSMPIYGQSVGGVLAELVTTGEPDYWNLSHAAGIDIRSRRNANPTLDEYTEINSEVNAIERDIKEAKTAKNKEAEKVAKQKRTDYRFNYNRTKSRLGYAKKRLGIVNKKIKVLTLKEKLGKELNAEETKRLKDLEAQKQKIMEQFLEVVKRSKR